MRRWMADGADPADAFSGLSATRARGRVNGKWRQERQQRQGLATSRVSQPGRNARRGPTGSGKLDGQSDPSAVARWAGLGRIGNQVTSDTSWSPSPSPSSWSSPASRWPIFPRRANQSRQIRAARTQKEAKEVRSTTLNGSQFGPTPAGRARAPAFGTS